MTRLLPTPSLWRLAAAVSPKTSDALAGGVNERVLAHPSRRQKRRRPPQCHVPCREAATPYPRPTAALPSSSSQACPRRPRISTEPMKHPVPIGRTACRVIRHPSFASSAPSALRSPGSGARYRRSTVSGRFRDRNLVGLGSQSKRFFWCQECGVFMT